MISFIPVRSDEEILLRYVALFLACFPNSIKYNKNYLEWLYCQNPAGNVIGFDAWDGDRLAAHYACIPVSAVVGGNNVKVLLSLNTATHPEYQGIGLFTKLAELTYAAGAGKNFDCVYGIANANSTPGFVRKLGFQFVEPLRALIGVGYLNIDFDGFLNNLQFERVWEANSLEWRCANPMNKIFCEKRDDRVRFHATAVGKILSAYAELSPKKLSNLKIRTSGLYSPTRIFLGLIPDDSARLPTYFNIPQYFRPSPLNFIYRSLSGSVHKLEKGEISLSFLDFDAY